jgi:hypothetical protein
MVQWYEKRCQFCLRPVIDITGALPGTIMCQDCGNRWRAFCDHVSGRKPAKSNQQAAN